MNPVDLRLYGIVDPAFARGRNIAELAGAAVAGGCTVIQYRDKGSDTRALIETARRIKAALVHARAPFLVNDRVDVALAAQADGVHLGHEDMDPNDARRLLGPSAIIGATVKSADEAERLADLPIDYACIGGVFATASKQNPTPPIGLDSLATLVLRVRRCAPHLPVGAIAGIDREKAPSAIAAGADGVAVISAIFAADDVAGAARALRKVVDQALSARGAA